MTDDKFWSDLTTRTRNALLYYRIKQPWKAPVEELLRTPGIGPSAIKEIAKSTQKNGTKLIPPSTPRPIANDR